MAKNEVVPLEEHDESALTAQPNLTRSVVIPDALPMRLQTLDLARHTVIAPDDRRYVVATFNDTRLGNGYVTAVYPQQNNYLTLIRLRLYEFSSATPDEALQRHIALAQAIQQGKLQDSIK